MRLTDRLEDDERLEAILKKWAHLAPSIPCTASHSTASTASQRIRAGARSEISSLESDVQRAKAGVNKLESRMHRLKQRSS